MSQSRVHGVRHGSRRFPGPILNALQVQPGRPSTAAASEQQSTLSAARLAQRHSAQRQLSQEFATLLGVGIPPLEGLKSLRSKTAFRPLARAIESVIAMLQSGHPLHAALVSQPSAFDPTLVAAIQSRESTRQFELALFEYAACLDRDDAFASSL